MLCCYLITNEKNTRTYIGATKNFNNRLRQHNGEIKGGAKYTRGDKWHPIILISGFNSWNETLSFEWHFRHFKSYTKNRLYRHTEALNILLTENLTVEIEDTLAAFIWTDNIIKSLLI